MRMAWRNFIRNRRSTLAAVLAVAALAAFLLVYSDNIRRSEAELDNAYETVPVNAYIAGASATQLPSFNETLYRAILDSGFVASSEAAAQCQVNDRDTLRALDSMQMDAPLSEYAPGMEWLEGYDESLFAGAEAVCVAPRGSGFALGDEVRLPVRTRRSAVAVLTVVGLYGSEFDYGDGRTYYCPLAFLRTLFEENNLSFSYCGLEMQLCNTRELSTFKAQMKELKLDGGRTRLVVNDALLISITTQLSRHISLLKTLLPFLFALAAAIGFVLSFLLLRGRRREAAVMRSLGAKRGRVFAVLLLETGLQAACGVAAGSLAAYLIAGRAAVSAPHIALVFACYLLGGAAAVFRLARVNVLRLMTARE